MKKAPPGAPPGGGGDGNGDDDYDFKDLWAFLRARHGDPDTSHASMHAYDKPKMGEAAACVVAIYQEHGELADFQLKPLFENRFKRPHSFHLYRQARSVARDKGKIVDTKKRILNPQTKRFQVVWAYVDGDEVKIRKCPLCGHVLGRE